MQKKIIVTGGLGFIGKNFIKYFHKNLEKIIVIDKVSQHSDKIFFKNFEFNNIEFINEDIGDFSFQKILDLYEYDIINFASESHVDRSFENPIVFSNSNYISTHKLLETLKNKKFKGRFLHISTDEVYGESKIKPASETQLLRPTNPYSVSKAAADILCQTYYRCYNLNIVIIRPNNIYGPYQHVEKIIPAAISSIHNDKKINIQGDGMQKRSFLHVNDFNSACEILLNHEWNELEHRIFNISSNNEFTIMELVKKIVSFSNKNIDDCIKFISDRIYNDFRYLVSSDRIKKLGWSEKVSFEEEIKKLYVTNSVFFGNQQ